MSKWSTITMRWSLPNPSLIRLKPQSKTWTTEYRSWKAEEYSRNSLRIVKCVSEAILFCGRQCIDLRGDNEVLNEDSCGNTGNFLAALQMIANHDDILKQHLDNIQLSSRNITYMSPLIQNEVIEIIGQDIILKNLLQEIKAAKLYSVMADEVTSHNIPRAISVVCTLYRQEQRCQEGLYCLYSSASNNWRGNCGNDSVYFARSWSGNRERQGSGVRWCS